MTADDTHFLLRAILELIDTAEQAELEINRRLLKEKQDAERVAPLLRYRGDTAYERLRKQHPGFRLDLEPADFLLALAEEWESRATASDAQLRNITEPEPLRLARDRVLEARAAFRRATARRNDIERDLAWIDQQIRQLRGEISQDQLGAWLKANVPSEHECGRTLAEAIEWECPLAVGRKLPIENGNVTIPTAPSLQQLEQQKAREEERLRTAIDNVGIQQRLLQSAETALRQETEKHDDLRTAIASQRASDNAVAVDARRAHADISEADTLAASIEELEQNIRRSQERQTAIREQKNAALSAFSETFARVVKTILGDEVSGSIRFNGRKIRPTLIHDIDLTSAALETLKIICLDLAALISGVEGRGQHPRFLIHDGPREADMDAMLYEQLFRLVQQLEDSFGKRPIAFQYIITTTEPPPRELQNTPWLLTPPLDGTHTSGMLLGKRF
jgi:hypothetical protein